MSRQYQDPSYHSGHYQTPHPNRPQQLGQPTQPMPIPRGTYTDHRSQHAAYPSYHEGSPQSQPPRQRHSPYAGPVPFLESQGSPTSYPQTYLAPPQTTPIFSGAFQQERQGPYGYPSPPSTISSPNWHRSHLPGGSDAGGSSSFYSQPSYNAAQAAQPPVWNASGYEEEHEYRPKGPPIPPTGTPKPPCRLPRCNKLAFFDRRVNETREWCSDEHMRAAIINRVEKPCKTCGRWPRLNGYKFCSGNVCRYPVEPVLPSQTTANLAVGTGCRYRDCRNQVFFDRRVNRRSEWCDHHLQVATVEGLETPCKICRVWPRRRDYEFCGGDICLNPHRV